MTNNQMNPQPQPAPQGQPEQQSFTQPSAQQTIPQYPQQQTAYQYQYIPQTPAPQSTVATAQKPLFKDKRMWLGFVIGILVGVLGTFLATTYLPTLTGPTLTDVYTSCKDREGAYITLNDDGAALTLRQSNNSSSMDMLQCVIDGTNMPDSTVDKIGQTTALSGMQEDEWDGFKATWTYKGGDDYSDGLTLIIESN